MKTLISIFTVIILGLSMAQAQRVDDYVRKLQIPDGKNGASASVKADSPSMAITNSSTAVQDKVPGFRVCIFFDNSQSARQAASATQSQLVSLYPGVSHYMVYSNPMWKVMAGDCITRAEATHLLGKLRTTFPKAFIVNEMMPVRNLIITKDTALSQEIESGDEKLVEGAE